MLLPAQSAKRWVGFWVAMLLLAQTLGLIHGVVHGSALGPPLHLQGSAHTRYQYFSHPDNRDNTRAENTVHAGHAGWLNSLFSLHDGDSKCLLFDHACNGAAAPAIALSTQLLTPSSHVMGLWQSEALARWAALFQARGPPLTF